MTRWILIVAASFCFGCDVVSISEEPLNAEECGQLMDKIHEITREGLTGEDLEWFDQSHLDERPESVRDCVEDPAWGRRGFQCMMTADSEGDMRRCVMRGG